MTSELSKTPILFTYSDANGALAHKFDVVLQIDLLLERDQNAELRSLQNLIVFDAIRD